MALNVGQRVVTKADTNRTKAGEKGTIASFDTWSGEEYPYVVDFDDGTRGAYARHELGLVGDSLPKIREEADALLALRESKADEERAELLRLRKLEARLLGYIERQKELARKLGGVAVECRSNKNYLGSENLTRQADDIMYRVRRLEALFDG